MTDEKTYQDWDVNFQTNAKVVDIDRTNKNVVTRKWPNHRLRQT